MAQKKFIAEKKVYKNYPYHAAGKVWTIPQVTFVIGPDKSLGLTPSELRRISFAIANEIIGSPKPLSPDELDFLRDITATKYSDIAKVLGTARSNISLWREPGKEVPRLHSLAIKRWFWVKIFASELESLGMLEIIFSVQAMSDDASLLAAMRSQAISTKITFPLKKVS